MSAFTKPLAQAREALARPQGLDGRMCECVDCARKAEVLAALDRVERLATDMETALRDAHAWIDTSMHSADDDLEGGHALLIRLAALTGKGP